MRSISLYPAPLHACSIAARIRKLGMKSIIACQQDNAMDQEAAKPVRRHEIREQLEKIQIKRRSHERGVPSVEKVMGGLYRANSRYIHGRALNILRLYDIDENRFRTASVNEEAFFGDEWNSIWLVSYSLMMCFAAVQARFRNVIWRSDMRALAESFWAIAELETVSVQG